MLCKMYVCTLFFLKTKIMNTPIPFQIINWSNIEATIHPGITGHASWKTIKFGNLRLRQVTYSPNYLADHWCQLGHIIYCLQGSMETELAIGEKHTLNAGETYIVSDNQSSHRTFSENGCVLFITDGGFLDI